MKQFFKHRGWSLSMLAMVISFTASAQSAEGYYGPVINTGQLSHGVGIGAQAFSILTGGSFDGYTNGRSVDNFTGPNGLPGTQEIGGIIAPGFDTLKLNNGATSAFNITNTAGIVVNGALAFNNGITTTLRTNRTAGLAGAIQFLGSAVYTPAFTPAAGPDLKFIDGFVSKVNPAGFVYPIGNVTALRPVTVSGTGTFTAGWSNLDIHTSPYAVVLPLGITAITSKGYWEWSGTAIATATLSIPDVSTFTSAANLTVVGYNGTAWVNLGGVFATNTENSTNGTAISVPANIQAMVLAEIGVPLSLKVFLAGDINAGATMRNDLQNYFGGNVGLLPSISPYGGVTNTYALISNPTGPVGAVADWITVEVRVASNNYNAAMETQYLLLKTDGSIVTTTGTIPVFAAQTGTVRVIIKHRNHLAIMSNDITGFNTSKSYDFSTSLSQASNAFGDPAQMTLKFGKWCMWAGDTFNDNFIDGTDRSTISGNLGKNDETYLINDLNMDGFADGTDRSLLNFNLLTAPNSTLNNY